MGGGRDRPSPIHPPGRMETTADTKGGGDGAGGVHKPSHHPGLDEEEESFFDSFVAGGVAGLADVVMHPLETLSVRAKVHPESGYGGMLGAARKIWAEGVCSEPHRCLSLLYTLFTATYLDICPSHLSDSDSSSSLSCVFFVRGYSWLYWWSVYDRPGCSSCYCGVFQCL